MCFAVLCGKFQSYKFHSCYSLNYIQQVQILLRVTLGIQYTVVEFDSLAPSYPLISLFFEK